MGFYLATPVLVSLLGNSVLDKTNPGLGCICEVGFHTEVKT